MAPKLTWTTSASSLLLSQLVYYNTWFSLIQVFFGVGVVAYKVRGGGARARAEFCGAGAAARAKWVGTARAQVRWLDVDGTWQILVPLLTALWVLVEPGRLWLGYSGNLRERVPELAAFILLTLLPQFVVLLVLGFIPPRRFPIETILVVPQLIFLVVEVVTAYWTVRLFMARQTAAFFRSVQEEGADVAHGQHGQPAPVPAQYGTLRQRSAAHAGVGGESISAAPPSPPQRATGELEMTRRAEQDPYHEE